MLIVDQDGQGSIAGTLMTEDDDSKEIMGSTASLETVESEDLSEVTELGSQTDQSSLQQQDDYVNPRGVRFTPQEPVKEGI